MRFMGGPVGEDDAWRQIALFTGHWELRGHGFWVVEREGAMIGRVWLWRPHGWPVLEVGWLLAREAWGQGYATEAARASVEHAWRRTGVERLISLIAPENDASARVAQRLGMRPGTGWSIRGEPVIIHALARPDAAAPR